MKSTSAARLAACALAWLPCAGCSTLRVELGPDLELEACAELRPEQARLEDVLAALGPPTALGPHAGGLACLYEHVLTRERQLGFQLDRLGLWVGVPQLALVKLSMARSTSLHRAALFLFDEQGLLVAAAGGEWDEVRGKGGGLQLVFAVEQVTDPGSLEGTPRGLTDGRELLEPLPDSLDLAHRADLELRGAPAWFGQGVLAMPPEEGEERGAR